MAHGPITKAATTATAPTPATTATSLRNPMRNSSNFPALASADSFGQQRGLHRLEQEQRDAGDDHRGEELRDQFLLVLAGEDLHGDRARR